MPKLISFGTIINTQFVQCSAGEKHSLFLNEQGTVYVTGCNSEGQLGLGKEVNFCNKPQVIQQLKNMVSSVSCFKANLAVTKTGSLFFWGKGVTSTVFTPQLVNCIPSKIKDAQIGRTMGLIVDQKNTVWVFGSNSSGELGLGDCTSR